MALSGKMDLKGPDGMGGGGEGCGGGGTHLKVVLKYPRILLHASVCCPVKYSLMHH